MHCRLGSASFPWLNYMFIRWVDVLQLKMTGQLYLLDLRVVFALLYCALLYCLLYSLSCVFYVWGWAPDGQPKPRNWKQGCKRNVLSCIYPIKSQLLLVIQLNLNLGAAWRLTWSLPRTIFAISYGWCRFLQIAVIKLSALGRSRNLFWRVF